MGDMHEIPQGEGGEQGDPLMPMLFAMGQHRALEAVQRRLVTMKSCSRSWTMCTWFAHPRELLMFWQFWHRSFNVTHTSICTRARPKCGTEAVRSRKGIEAITRAARAVKPDAIVWRGETSLPPEEQGIKVLGAPIGHPAFVHKYLEKKSIEQAELFQRIPHVKDTQACWLLLLMCAATRANFWLRMVRSEDSLAFAERHDDRVWDCFRAILGTPAAPVSAKVLAHLHWV